MEVSFKNRSLRTVCEEPEAATARYGGAMARDLFNRMADLLAAECIADVVAGTPVVSETGMAETVSISVGMKHSMVLKCGHINPPMTASGKVDWSMVSRVRVEKIEGDDA